MAKTKTNYALELARLRLNFYCIVGSALILTISPLILVYVKHFNFLKAISIGLVIALLWVLINISAFKSVAKQRW